MRCRLNGEDYLWYKAPAKIHVALLRGTTADLDGNVSLEREALLGDVLNQVGSTLLVTLMLGPFLQALTIPI